MAPTPMLGRRKVRYSASLLSPPSASPARSAARHPIRRLSYQSQLTGRGLALGVMPASGGPVHLQGIAPRRSSRVRICSWRLMRVQTTHAQAPATAAITTMACCRCRLGATCSKAAGETAIRTR